MNGKTVIVIDSSKRMCGISLKPQALTSQEMTCLGEVLTFIGRKLRQTPSETDEGFRQADRILKTMFPECSKEIDKYSSDNADDWEPDCFG